MEYPQIKIKKGRERSLINRHPWVFSGAIDTKTNAKNGDIVRVIDENDQTLGYGFYDSQSQINVRLFEMSSDSSLKFHTEYWHRKIQNAFKLRAEYVCSSHTNAYRLLHAEGDFLPGIIADAYADILVLQVLVKGIQQILPILLDAFKKLGFKGVYVKSKTSNPNEKPLISSSWMLTPPNPTKFVEVLENNIKFLVNIEDGQKTGFFLDQRENRALLGSYSKGKSVLNTFSYSGGFSMYALAAGALLVDSVDISKDAVEQSKINAEINFGKNTPHNAYAQDCFEYLRTMESSYDVIVLDPPAFAKHSKAVQNASRGYKDINLKAFEKIKPGGILFTFSCSQHIDKELFRKIVFAAASDAKRNVRILHQLSQPIDHPVNIYHPEGEYLKGLVLYVE